MWKYWVKLNRRYDDLREPYRMLFFFTLFLPILIIPTIIIGNSVISVIILTTIAGGRGYLIFKGTDETK